MYPFALHIFKVNSLRLVCWFVSLSQLDQSTPAKTHPYSKMLSSPFLPFRSPCEDCSVGVMFWVRLLFFLSGFQPIAQQKVLLRNPEFQKNFWHFWGTQRQQQRHYTLSCRRKHNKRQTSMFTTTPTEWIDNNGNQTSQPVAVVDRDPPSRHPSSSCSCDKGPPYVRVRPGASTTMTASQTTPHKRFLGELHKRQTFQLFRSSTTSRPLRQCR